MICNVTQEQLVGPLKFLVGKGERGATARIPCLALLVDLLASLTQPEAVLAGDETRLRSFEAKGVKTHFLVVGKGEPVVLIHGLHSSLELNWRMTGVVAEIAKDHQDSAFDLPGHGLSGRPEKETLTASSSSRMWYSCLIT
jgi:pimeloyl-ACP methyl ester carboxylesterase